MHEFLKKQWQDIKPNAKWEAVKLVGAVVIPAAFALLQKSRHLSFDWVAFVSLFLVSAFVFLWFGRNKPTSAQPNSKSSAVQDEEPHSRLSRELAVLREKLNECEQKRQMPRLYLDVADSNQSMFRQTSFTLINRGGDVAHNIHILPLEVHYKKLTFDPIPILVVGEEKKAAGTISGMGIMQDRDVLSLMVSEWNAAFDGGGLACLEASEWAKKIKVEYEDFTGKKFEMTCELVVYPIDKMLSDKHSNDEWPKPEYKTVEVRKVKFSAL